MKALQLAEITFGFRSQLNMKFPPELALFQIEAPTAADFTYDIVAEQLPPVPESAPDRQGLDVIQYQLAEGCRSYSCVPSGKWDFCLTENGNSCIMQVIPEHANYMQNMWNVVSRIQLTSRLLEHGAVMLHSSYLIYNGHAILFTAASGVGKSTQAELWRKTLGAEVINGDRSIIREKNGGLWAFGTPYSGTSGICKNVSAPIRAIVTLEQAPENTVRPLTRKECTRFFLAQTTIQRWKPEDVIGTIELWDSFITKVPVLRLACRPDEDAVYTLKNYLDALDKEEKPL